MSDIFREVDEELRRDKMYSLWKRYAWQILGGAALAIIIVGGMRGYQAWDRSQAGASGAKYSQALELLREEDEAGRAALAELAVDGYSAYPVLAKLREAAVLGKNDEATAAVTIYDAISSDAGVSDMLRDLARIRAALLLVDTVDQTEIRLRLEALAESEGAWRHTARELIALSLYRAADYPGADADYDRIMSDPAVPVGLRGRAEMMRAVIAPKLATGDQ